MRRSRWLAGALVGRALSGMVLAGFLVALLAAPAARAGVWVQVSCVNPDGSAAPSQGWTGASGGSPELGSQANPRCTPQVPMEAILFGDGSGGDPAPYGAQETLQYAPPAGSSIIGGTLDVGLYADGYGSGDDDYDWGSAGVFEPASEQTSANTVKVCTESQPPACENGTNDYVGDLSLPAQAGGDVYLEAYCNGFNPNGGCDTGGSNGAWALAELYGADIELANDAVPSGARFTGGILRAHASGDASLRFTAADPGGPGVYLVSASIDGRVVLQGTPDTEDGTCVPVGADASTHGLMFDDAQPCPTSEPVSLAIPTSGLRDGRHRLTVSVTDAAGNVTRILSREISTRNSGATQTRLPRLDVRLTFDWHWDRARTRLHGASAAGAPVGARGTVSCRGAGCPRLPAGSPSLSRLLRRMRGRVFSAGDRIVLVVRTRGHAPERVSIAIRNGARPLTRLGRGG